VGEALALIILLVLSGVFSGSETALTSLSLARAEALNKQGRTGAGALYALKLDPSRMLITILIGNNVVNIAASALATVVAVRWFGDYGPSIAVGVLTILILTFGEITPKSLATRHAEGISLFIAPVMLGLTGLLYPLVWLFLQITDLVHKLTGGRRDPVVTETELITMVEHGEEEGVFESDERQMIERVFFFNDLKATDVMTPRREVFGLDESLRLREALGEIVDKRYTRIPLYSHDPDEILYVLHSRDVMEALAEGRLDAHLSELAHPAIYVPENQPIDELLTLLRKQKQHMAVVVDEHGYMQGVVTLEDLLEELVGEIYDETDEPPQDYLKLSDESLLVDGIAELRVVEEFFGTDLPGKPTDTVNRWILGHTERIPAVDEVFTIDGLEVKVQSATSRRIIQVVLTRPKPPEPFEPQD